MMHSRALIVMLAAVSTVAFAGNGSGSGQGFHRTYKASAYVTVLSIPIFSRSGVGYGSASADEQNAADSRTMNLQFLSGSIPERAHGLNRFGFIQENVREANRALVEADYFGVITSNGEESLAQAKAALATKKQGDVAYTAAQASLQPQSAKYTVRHMMLPQPKSSTTNELLREARATFDRGGESPKTVDPRANPQSLDLFLHSLQRAIRANEPVYNGRFMHNEKTFRLHTEKRRDDKVRAELQKEGLVDGKDTIIQMSGVVQNEKSGEKTVFYLWFTEGSPNFLPLRFEFRPKSFLRLVFDAQPGISGAKQTLAEAE